jgi:hypothetical protein
MTTGEYKRHKELTKENLRDNTTTTRRIITLSIILSSQNP